MIVLLLLLILIRNSTLMIIIIIILSSKILYFYKEYIFSIFIRFIQNYSRPTILTYIYTLEQNQYTRVNG